MGLFSKKVTTVGTSVTRVIEDSALPNSISVGSIKAKKLDDTQTTEYIMEELVNSIALKCNRMYKYGKDFYEYGLPESHIISSHEGQELVESILEDKVGTTVKLEYYHFGSLNLMHYGWIKLLELYGYDTQTNELKGLSVSKGYPVYLKDMQVVVQEATLQELGNGSLDQWGVPPSSGFSPESALMTGDVKSQIEDNPFLVDPTAISDYIKVTYVWETNTTVIVEGVSIQRKVIKEESLNIQASEFQSEDDFYQVMYSYSGKVDYWLYKANSGNQPALDSIFNKDSTGLGTYFPFLYLRYEKKSMDTLKGTKPYNDTKKMMKYLNIDLADMVKNIHDNPDINDVEQSILMMAVPANTKDPLEQRYLFDYFTQLFLNDNGDGNAYEGITDVQTSLINNKPDRAILIQDKRFKMSLGYKNIVKRRVVGKIGKLNAYGSGYSTQTQTKEGSNTQTGAKEVLESTTPCHYYQFQVTEDMYEEVRVYGLKMVYYIFEQYTTTGDETDNILMIPLDHSITELYSIPKREVLFARSLHLIFNSRIITKLKWYQTPLFRAIMIVAAIVVTVISAGTTWSALAASVAAGTITLEAAIYTVLLTILAQAVVGIAITLFVKLVGPKFAIIAAIVLALAGYYQAFEAGSIQGAPWAEDLLKLSTGLTKAAESQIKLDYEDLLKDADDFSGYVDEQMKKLDTATDLLENNNILSPLILIGETPDEYFQRTVHSGNIGAVGFDAITQYYDVALTLPTIKSTVGEANDF